MACGILVPQPGTEPGLSAVNVQSPNHWVAREFPETIFLRKQKLCIEKKAYEEKHHIEEKLMSFSMGEIENFIQANMKIITQETDGLSENSEDGSTC